MSTAETKARIHELLVAGFAERGFTFAKLPRKAPNAGRYSPFVKSVALSSPASLVTWTITIDIYVVNAGRYISPNIHCEVLVHALDDLLGPASRPPPPAPQPSPTVFFTTGGVTRGDATPPPIFRDEDPEPSIRELFRIVDTVVLPRFEKYSRLENLIEGLAPFDGCRFREIVDGNGLLWPSSFMAAIGAAFLLGNLSLCEAIARRAKAELGYDVDDPGSFRNALADSLAGSLAEFYQMHLAARGVDPAAWLPSTRPADDRPTGRR